MTLLQPAASAAAVAAIMAGRPELLGSADSLLGHVEAWLQPVGCGIMTIHYLCAVVFNSYFQIGVKVCQCQV